MWAFIAGMWASALVTSVAWVLISDADDDGEAGDDTVPFDCACTFPGQRRHDDKHGDCLRCCPCSSCRQWRGDERRRLAA